MGKTVQIVAVSFVALGIVFLLYRQFALNQTVKEQIKQIEEIRIALADSVSNLKGLTQEREKELGIIFQSQTALLKDLNAGIVHSRNKTKAIDSMIQMHQAVLDSIFNQR